ncbi:hypothetical protein HZ326_31780 [Fusarium oxysporum f. sp. albedinis]|nr:hypothetical protein HZ326_31780 [Fusarium oxysporum f. sp. albedinis]
MLQLSSHSPSRFSRNSNHGDIQIHRARIPFFWICDCCWEYPIFRLGVLRMQCWSCVDRGGSFLCTIMNDVLCG